MGCASSIELTGAAVVCREILLLDGGEESSPTSRKPALATATTTAPASTPRHQQRRGVREEEAGRSVRDLLKEARRALHPPRGDDESENLRDHKMFDSRSFRDSTSRPLSLLALMAVLPSAETIGEGVEHLPSLLGTLARSVRKKGSGAQARAINVVQFMFAQLQEGGALYPLQQTHPLLILAAGLCALLSSEAGALDISRREKQRLLSRNTPASPLRVDDRSKSSTSGAVTRSLSLSNILRSSLFFQSLSDGKRFELMAALYELRRMGDPQAVKSVVESESVVMQYADNDTQALFRVQTTLLVAFHSHVLRKFKTHQQWCAESIVANQGRVVSPADHSTTFAFRPGDEASERFARSHVWVLQYIIQPLFHLWARVTPDAASSRRLCGMLVRTIDSYRIICHQKPAAAHSAVEASEGSLQNSTLSESQFGIFRKCHTSSEMMVIDDEGDQHPPQQCDDTSIPPELPCPLFRNNSHDVELPYDSTGVLSICFMYNVNCYSMLVCRRYDNGLSGRSGLATDMNL